MGLNVEFGKFRPTVMFRCYSIQFNSICFMKIIDQANPGLQKE